MSLAPPLMRRALLSVGNDSSTKLLLHCDGLDEATTFPDASASAHTVTASGAAQVDTAQSKFGGASANFGGGGALTVPTSADWAFGTADFTVDFWLRATSLNNYQAIMGCWNTGANNGDWRFVGLSGGQINFEAGGIQVVATSVPLNAWHHIAAVRASGTTKLYLNGAEADDDATVADVANTYALKMGSYYVTGANSYAGWLDEVRISKGVARWTAPFTPPDRAYG